MRNSKDEINRVGLSPYALALRDELAEGQLTLIRRMTVSDCTLEVRRGYDTLWVLVRRPGNGGFALRAVHSPGVRLRIEEARDTSSRYEFQALGSQGCFRVGLEIPDPAQPLLRCTVRLTPAEDLRAPRSPRDLYPLDENGDPGGAVGAVHAAQRGLNSGFVYLSLAEPQFGGLLYFQNLTALNEYFAVTGTTPDGRVGGLWPELGYKHPHADARPIPRGKEIVISDALVHWSPTVPQSPQQSAALFLDLLAGVYRQLDRPAPEYHDWPHCAEATLRDIEHAPEATIRHYENLYLHPYTASEYPDSMVQLITLLPMRAYETWRGAQTALTGQLRKGVKRFFDPKLNVVRRYLPNVGKDKDADAVDSWYLYHPLTNLARLASGGDEDARDMFLKSLEYGIKVARHFKYVWPVQYKIHTLEIITGPRKPGDPGQSDTGGLYAYVMLQAFDLTHKTRYLEEAKRAIHALQGMEFELEYQANISAWGAVACLRLWQNTGQNFFCDQMGVFLASFFHNCAIWESEIGFAKNYPVFLGVTCLHDGPYLALYECFESFAAFHELLTLGGEDISDPVKLLLAEYCKYALSRAWYYYPKELPKDALSAEVRNGHIDRNLAFPLEDLYVDGQPAGQVGQEIYGCGASFAFTTRSYHRFTHAPFMLFCNYPIYELDENTAPSLSFRVHGALDMTCQARLIPAHHRTLPAITVVDEHGHAIPSHMTEEGHCEFDVSVAGVVKLRWEIEPD